jgi:hypothetical protein
LSRKTQTQKYQLYKNLYDTIDFLSGFDG